MTAPTPAVLAAPAPLVLAHMLYYLQFPTKAFTALPEPVQASYQRDAERLLAMMADVTLSVGVYR